MSQTLTAERFLSIPASMVTEIASALEDGKVVASRYGYSDQEWDEISKTPAFVKAVSVAKAEMDRNGTTFKLKASVMADALLDDMFSTAMKADVPLKDKATALSLLTRVAELEPKTNTQVQAGPGFSITINIPTAPVDESKVVSDQSTVETIEPKQITLNFKPESNPKPIEAQNDEESEDS